MTLKLYNGPTTSKSEDAILSPAVVSMQTDTYQSNPAGGPLSVYTSPWALPASRRVFKSLYAPKFRKLVDEGWVCQFPYFRETNMWGYTPCTVHDSLWTGTNLPNYTWATYSNMVDFLTRNNDFIGITFPDQLHSRAVDEAVTRVFAKANAPNADLLIDLFQFKETVMMFISALRTLYRLIRSAGAFADLRPRGGSTRRVRVPPYGNKVSLQNLSGLWCELRFGWRPLLATLEGVIDALNGQYGESERLTYRASEDFSFKDEKVKTLNPSIFGFKGTAYFRSKATFTSTIRSGLLLERTTTLAEALGLDVKFLPIALWDIVPYSFIIDRFVNVGNYIRSLNPIPVTAFGGSWVVERYEHQFLYSAEYMAHSFSSGSGSSYRRWDRSPGKNEVTNSIVGVRRHIIHAPPSAPVLRHDWSEFQNLYNLIDAIFLAIQRFGPHR